MKLPTTLVFLYRKLSKSGKNYSRSSLWSPEWTVRKVRLSPCSSSKISSPLTTHPGRKNSEILWKKTKFSSNSTTFLIRLPLQWRQAASIWSTGCFQMDTVSTRTGPHVPQLKEMLATNIWGKTNKLHWSKITSHFLLVYLKLFLRLQLFTLVWNGNIFSIWRVKNNEIRKLSY